VSAVLSLAGHKPTRTVLFWFQGSTNPNPDFCERQEKILRKFYGPLFSGYWVSGGLASEGASLNTTLPTIQKWNEAAPPNHNIITNS